MWLFIKGCLLASLLFIETTVAQCNADAFTTASSGAPAALQHNYDGTSDTADGASVTFTCNNGNNDYLQPDPNTNGQFLLTCSGTSFTPVTEWPTCVKKCATPTPQTGYAAQANPNALIMGGQSLDFTCAEANKYPGGSAEYHRITCNSADGTFPTDTWPTCELRCKGPAAGAGYSDPNNHVNTYITPTTEITYQCSGTNEYVGDTSSATLTMTCQNDGRLSPATFPACIKKCATPSAQAGYSEQADTTALILGGGTLSYSCSQANFYPGGVTSPGTHTITCNSATGTFPTDTWPTCTPKCKGPAPQTGYSDFNNHQNKYFSQGDPATYKCSGTNEYSGTSNGATHSITCGADGTFPQDPWPACSKKCATPTPGFGFDAQPNSDLVAIDGKLTYTCSNANFYVSGNAPTREHIITCSATGQFTPSTWPNCIAKCQAPAVDAAYDDPDNNAGNFFAVGATISYKCKNANELSGSSTSNMHQMTCQDTGIFSNANFPACQVKCLIPQPEVGYKALISTTPVAVGEIVTFECQDAQATVGNEMKSGLNLTCGSDGTFPTGWDTCAVRCAVHQPNATKGYNPQAAGTPPALKGATLTYTCATAGHTVGDTLKPFHTITCGNDGTFPNPDTWPSCEMKCRIPLGEAGYNNQSSSLGLAASVGQKLNYTCTNSGETVGDTLKPYHEIECANTGNFPTGWPKCAIKCAIPTPENGYNAPADTTPIALGETVSFTCSQTGALVGSTTSNKHTLTCPTTGVLPSGWPTCDVRCVPPKGEQGYNSQPAGTGTKAVGESLKYYCMNQGELSGNSSVNYHTVTCGSNGQFPSSWPKCETRCLIPKAESGYAEQTATGSIAVGATLKFTCAGAEEEAGSTKLNYYEIKCASDGRFPTGWPVCSIPKVCPDPPAAGNNSTLTLTPAGQTGIKAYRSAIYACPNAGEVTDEGKTIELACLPTGVYAPRSTWPLCRAAKDCPGPVPVPPESSGLANSSSTVAKEGDQATYTCKESGWTVLDKADFNITCGSTGAFTNITWPTCQDPHAAFANNDNKTCHCLGDVAADKAKVLRDTICRDKHLSNIAGGRTPPTHKRCGTTNLANITMNTLCYCDSPLQQSKTSFWHTLRIRNQPWEWVPLNNGQHPLMDPSTSEYKQWANRVMKSIDEAIEASSLAGKGLVQSNVYRFRKGGEVPLNVFPSSKPQQCTDGMLSNITLPARLTRQGSGNVDAGATVTFKCSGAKDALFQPGASGALVVSGQVVLTCNSGGTAFTGIPSSWPECREISDTCPVPTPDGAKGYSALTGATPVGIDGSYTFNCADGAHVVAGTTSKSYNVKCVIASKADSPFYEVKIETEPSAWPACGAPTAKKRKKRATAVSGYHYILVDLETQFVNDSNPTNADFTAFLNSLGGTSGEVGTIVIDSNCTTSPCGIIQPDSCSNEFFEKLPPGYKALTPYGFYVPPLDPSLVDSANKLKMGEIAELRCTSTNPMQYPREDKLDHDPNDRKLTVYCIPPDVPGQSGQWSMSTVPHCASVCKESIYDAPPNTDLILTKVIPYLTPQNPVNYTEYNKTDSIMYSGDKLVYQCKTMYWGVHGGTDTSTDQFSCTDAGTINTPKSVITGQVANWPSCSPQTDMVVRAVELMLERYDRRISDRFKLIDFREEDFNASIINTKNYFLNVTIPVLCTLIVLIIWFCFCARPTSACCSLCRSKV